MLEFIGRKFACCDGVSRRSLLRVGAVGLGGLALPEVLKQRSLAADLGQPVRRTSLIFVELAGGPTHIETYDPKPDAPIEYRGPLATVETCVPGVRFSEFMVEQARIMDKLAVVRSITHDSSSHGTSAHLTQTGYYLRDPQKRDNDNPCIGSVTARVRAGETRGVPTFVSIPRIMRFGGAAYLGKSCNPFETVSDPAGEKFEVNNLALHSAMNLDRLDERRALLGSLDDVRRVVDTEGVAESLDGFTREAFELVTGDRARRAFDIAAEDATTRDRYGRNAVGQSMLLARRLVEAGVSCVTVRAGGWDDHAQIAAAMLKKGPDYDRGMAALVSDLHERGLDRDVLVVAMGEFGRTPRVNAGAGRDHWGAAMSVVLAGGGLKTGQVVGATNAKGEIPKDRPYRPENVLAVAYRHLGIDPAATFDDLSGRPRHILDKRDLIAEVV